VEDQRQNKDVRQVETEKRALPAAKMLGIAFIGLLLLAILLLASGLVKMSPVGGP
jgi:hypothetical protein